MPKSYRFDPVAITVASGASVTWTNHDEFTHNGESVSRDFDTSGSFPYLCSLHPREMTGPVDVQGGAWG